MITSQYTVAARLYKHIYKHTYKHIYKHTRLSYLRAGHGEHGACRVPLDAGGAQGCVDENRFFVALATHELHAAVVEADGERGRVGVGVTLQPVVPVHAHDVRSAGVPLHAVEGELGDGVSVAVVEVDLALHCAEDDRAAVGGPLHEGE
eukprot:1195823-Prorocentrum_minimum.AAC.13